ncbi:GntR family transcriptional regulator [Candidatus Solirubrobacter pratensis]|uniref:GntR family transcriptional regulator n=1 Tax=Candidatus Solirubrobacter pratensis TaxID=1298857 RepID=UPI0004898F80|nr:GntR family transcriptional regulator [Candidatus Solirubrobacter pratensis]
MRQLTPTSLREQAQQVIRASILAGELESGQIYSSATLAERLGVSPTPVREAMLELANGGLVEPVRNRGFRILTPDEGDLDEISALRIMLEAPSMRTVVERATDAQLRDLRELVTRIEAAAADADVAGFLLADRAFHLGMLELTGNGRLVRLVAQLRDQTRIAGISELAREGNLMRSAAEHREILDALEARDADQAEALMRRHLIHTRGIWAGRAEADATTVP